MLCANYKTKKDLKASIGKVLRYEETSMFGPEYKENGTMVVVGPSPHNRKWYAEVVVKNNLIVGVK